MSKMNNSKKNKKYVKKKNIDVVNLILNISLVFVFCYAVYLTVKLFFPIKDYEYIEHYAKVNDLDEALVCAVINVESSFNSKAVSPKGASGYMQIMEQTANWGIEVLDLQNITYDDILDEEVNIAIGTWYLRVLLDQFESEDLAIISYNAGSGNVSNWLKENGGDEVKTIQNIPFEETRKYLYKVKLNKFIYKILLIMQ